MKALTIRQPWASLIAHGVKTIETRSWSTEYRGPLAIHAGKRRPECTQWEEGPFDNIGEGDLIHQFGGWVNDAGHLVENPWWLSLAPEHRDYHPLPLGAVVATCTLADVVPMVAPDHVPPVNVATGEGRSILIHPDGSLWGNHCPDTTVFDWQDLTDQLPFGDFTPGRCAWLLTDIKPCDPVPAKGRLGMWDWKADR